MTPMIGIPACAREANGTQRHDTPARYAEAALATAGLVSVMIPPLGSGQVAVLDRLDGLLLPGSPSNVHPDLYGGGPSVTPELHDPARDATALALIGAALRRGMPVFAICRGIQELNVALGGTLHQAVHDLPGRMDHRGGPGDLAMRYRDKHPVALSGRLAAILGAPRAVVNSVHGQAIDRPAPGLAIEALAEDGTIEAVRVEAASGFAPPAFAIGVQWHPEWRAAENPLGLALFRAFGDACRAYMTTKREAA
ncbi:MAG: gamma-glutamyl-gamma-aminobutyrate hydrolase family protein [Rhodospirillales bacterium]|nr:gamma-glutamyl-gamma-aminobutyrate hydrolase family protein [Rhodospirillales bacterium]